MDGHLIVAMSIEYCCTLCCFGIRRTEVGPVCLGDCAFGESPILPFTVIGKMIQCYAISKHCYLEYNVIKIVIRVAVITVVADGVTADFFFHGGAIHTRMI